MHRLFDFHRFQAELREQGGERMDEADAVDALARRSVAAILDASAGLDAGQSAQLHLAVVMTVAADALRLPHQFVGRQVELLGDLLAGPVGAQCVFHGDLRALLQTRAGLPPVHPMSIGVQENRQECGSRWKTPPDPRGHGRD